MPKKHYAKEDETPYQTLKPTILIEDPILKKGFVQLPVLILKDPTLSYGAKLTYALLLSYAWQNNSCFPGQPRLANDLGVSDRSVIQYLKELSPRYIFVRRRGQGKSNVYLIRQLKKHIPEVKPASHQEVKSASPEVYPVEVNAKKSKPSCYALQYPEGIPLPPEVASKCFTASCFPSCTRLLPETPYAH